MKKILLVLFLVLCLKTAAISSTQDINDGDKLFEQSKFAESIVIYEEILEKEPANYEVLWKLSRSYSKQGNLEKKKKSKKNHFSKAVDYTKQAIEVKPNGFEGYLYLAESLGKLSKVEKSETKVSLTYEIKEAALKAIELNPSHFKAYMILGIWHRKIEDANWLEKSLAKSFFGGLPEASLAEAEKNLKKSIELKSDFIESHYELALVYKMLKKKDLAIEELEEAINYPTISEKQEGIKKKANSLLKKLR
jgi:tetratricopeptide (TPR) repeat protein